MDIVEQLNTALENRYAIEREVGAGGMATVYLARDVRHHRKVALKVLRPDLGVVLGADRFLSEIQVTANLQHPNLLPLFDSGDADGQLFYVMPYIDGESLRARLAREKQLPIEDALHIATSVASALDYAHRHGVIHRDLKPENILLHEGQPLVADFGIALAVTNAGGGRITQTGLSLGTPQYMSPEQATGDRVINARTDIYSLGAVTYEMLTGEPPHVGSTSQAIIARVLTETPRAIRSTRPHVPEHVERAVERALEKLPADRFATAHEFADALAGKVVLAPMMAPAAGATRARQPSQAGERLMSWRDTLRQPLTRALAAALALVLVVFSATEWKRSHTDDAAGIPVRFILTDDSVRWAAATAAPFALSPDGRLLAFIGRKGSPTACSGLVYCGLPVGGPPHLYLRSMSDLHLREIPGTEGAAQPFFSPDSKWVGFWIAGTPGHLMKVPIDGGTSVALADVGNLRGVSWGTPDQIIVSIAGQLAVVPSGGGTPRLIPGDTSIGMRQMWPLALADGKTVLYASLPATGLAGARIGVASLSDGKAHVLDLPGTHPQAIVDGQLIYASAAGAIMAVKFDLSAKRPVGTPVPVIDAVAVGGSGALQGSVSASGSVVYVEGGESEILDDLLIGGPHSPTRPVRAERRGYEFPRFSPDGKQLAVAVAGERTDVWIFDLPSGPFRRLTAEGSLNDRPEWTPDGREVLFRSNRGGRNAIWIQPADGHQPARLLFKFPNASVDEAILSPDGKFLFVQLDSTHAANGGQVFFRPLAGADTTVKLIAGSDHGQQVQARVSPDGHWVAYASSEQGTWEVYVKPFPALDRRYQVSLSGGSQPVWSRDGRRLFYIADGRLLGATLALSPFSVTARDTLLENVIDAPAGAGSPTFYHANYDVAPDGKSFVFLRGTATQAPVVMVHDWKYELRQRMAPRGGN